MSDDINNGTARKREKWIDMLRGFGMFLVIIGHAQCPDVLEKFIYGFHMPLFFVLSGFLFHETKCRQEDLQHYVRRKWKAYIIPYFVLCLCNLIATLGMEFLAEIRGRELLASAIRHLFYILYSFGDASKMPNCSPLWFLPCLFISDIYLYLFVRLSKAKKGIVLLAGLTVIACLAKMDITQLPWHFDIAFVGMIFMYIGFLVKKSDILNRMNIIHKIALAGVGGILMLQNSHVDMLSRNFGSPLLFFGGASCFVIFLMSVFCKLSGWKLMSYIGRNSMFYMGFNLLVNACLNIVEKRIDIACWMAYEWMFRTVVNVFCISLIVLLWNKFKKTAECCKI